jgi:hypothetical protein
VPGTSAGGKTRNCGTVCAYPYDGVVDVFGRRIEIFKALRDPPIRFDRSCFFLVVLMSCRSPLRFSR